MIDALTQLSYVVATALFILALHWMNDPKTARHGVYGGVAAMLIAVLATWAQPQVIVHHVWIALAIAAGFLVGWPLSRAPLTGASPPGSRRRSPRSEEHTSELQSPYDLVCRLLVQKKKTLPPLAARSPRPCPPGRCASFRASLLSDPPHSCATVRLWAHFG